MKKIIQDRKLNLELEYTALHKLVIFIFMLPFTLVGTSQNITSGSYADFHGFWFIPFEGYINICQAMLYYILPNWLSIQHMLLFSTLI